MLVCGSYHFSIYHHPEGSHHCFFQWFTSYPLHSSVLPLFCQKNTLGQKKSIATNGSKVSPTPSNRDFPSDQKPFRETEPNRVTKNLRMLTSSVDVSPGQALADLRNVVRIFQVHLSALAFRSLQAPVGVGRFGGFTLRRFGMLSRNATFVKTMGNFANPPLKTGTRWG